jgi:DNA-binding NarL/FixJ family response regulator
MNGRIQSRITRLVQKGWTLAAIADELGVTSHAVELWKAVKEILLMPRVSY